MLEKITEILKLRDYNCPRSLIHNYKKMNLNSDELVLMVYLLNNEKAFNPKQISDDLDLTLTEVMELINSLTTKGLINIEMHKMGSVRSEYINLDEFYKKLAFDFVDAPKKEKSTNIYDIFEKEFGRTLSPMEYEIISAWTEKTKEETILLALKEATYNGVSNLRYIDKILLEWSKKGISTEKDMINEKKKISPNKGKIESFDYDWLNDEERNI